MTSSPRQLALSLSISLAAAAAILMTVVLPAEYGIDPLGTGAALGLTELAAEPVRVVSAVDAKLHSDSQSFTLQPWESLEFKFQVVAAGGLAYEWNATRIVQYEFHGEPEGGPEGFAETWNKGEASADAGIAMLPFPGRHGWFFENRSLEVVTITLEVSGFYTKTLLYRDGFVTEYPVREPLR